MIRLSEWQKFVNEEKNKANIQVDKEIIPKNEFKESLDKQYIIKKNKEFDMAPKQELFKRITNQLQFESLQIPYINKTNVTTTDKISYNLDKTQNLENKALKNSRIPTNIQAKSIIDTTEKQKEKKNLERQELLNRLIDPILTLEEAAKILNVSKATIRRYTKSGKIKYYITPGNHRRFKLNDIISLLEKTPNNEITPIK